MTASLRHQVTDELDRALCGPVASLLGLDLADLLRQRIRDCAETIAAQLDSDDDHIAAEVVVDLMGLLWPHGDPDPLWWRSPLGLRCAASLGRAEGGAVSRSVAAAMLGVTVGTVDQLLHRGTLGRVEGGVSRADVLARLARLAR